MRLYSVAWYAAALTSTFAPTSVAWSGNTWDENTFDSETKWNQTFLTRSGQTTLILDVQINVDPSRLSPGYIFISSYRSFRSDRRDGIRDFGPHIFDREGNLIWAGNETVESRAWGPGPCDYEGEVGTHLCYADGVFMEQGSHTAGSIKFYDNSYNEIKRYEAAETGGLRAPDSHEVNPTDGGRTFLQDIYEVRPLDLRPYGGRRKGYFLDGCFHERRMRNGEVLFQWCLSDHVSLFEANVWVPQKGKYGGPAGNGSSDAPWDAFHINAVDKDHEGNYYVSSRNMGTIYKVAGKRHPKPGSIIWKLGGNDNHFDMEHGVQFSWQHHVRVHSVGGTVSMLSIMDNANDGIVSSFTSEASSGMVIEVNNDTMTARLTERYFHPNMEYTGFAGSTQLGLPNANIFIGWGIRGSMSEHAPGNPGEVLWFAKFGVRRDQESYRNWKADWKGFPKDPPDIFAYAESCTSDVIVYMSWNGATEYRGWKIFLANSDADQWTQVLGTWARYGYETEANIGTPETFQPYIYAQALDSNNKVMGTSKRVKVFVPSDMMARTYHCHSTSCGHEADYADTMSVAEQC